MPSPQETLTHKARGSRKIISVEHGFKSKSTEFFVHGSGRKEEVQQEDVIAWVVDSQFARIRKLTGFARIRPGYARLLDIVRIALLLTASPAARIRNSH